MGRPRRGRPPCRRCRWSSAPAPASSIRTRAVPRRPGRASRSSAATVTPTGPPSRRCCSRSKGSTARTRRPRPSWMPPRGRSATAATAGGSRSPASSVSRPPSRPGTSRRRCASGGPRRPSSATSTTPGVTARSSTTSATACGSSDACGSRPARSSRRSTSPPPPVSTTPCSGPSPTSASPTSDSGTTGPPRTPSVARSWRRVTSATAPGRSWQRTDVAGSPSIGRTGRPPSTCCRRRSRASRRCRRPR